MKKYECLYIVNINFDSEGISAVVARMEEILKNVGAEVKNTQHWGKRKLAYAIDKERYGNYVLLHFEGENPNIAEFQREVEIEKGVLHYMTIRLDEFPDFEALTVPQAVDADRKHRGMSSGPGGRRPPRRYGDEEAAEAPVAKAAPAADNGTAEATEEPEAEEAAAPSEDVAVAEPAPEVVAEEAAPVKEAVAEAPATEETPAEEPETPAEKAE